MRALDVIPWAAEHEAEKRVAQRHNKVDMPDLPSILWYTSCCA